MRRILRGAILRIVRPVLWPFLRRLRLWMRAAEAEAVSGGNRAAIQLDVIPSELASEAIRDDVPERVSEPTRGEVYDRLAALQLGVDSLRSMQLDAMKALQAVLARTDPALQRVSFNLDGNLLMRTFEGVILVPSEDTALVASVGESEGRGDRGMLSLLRAVLKQGDRVIDAGASIGLVSIPMAKYVGPTGHVIVIEPVVKLADLVRRSLAINDLSAIATIHRCALGAASSDGAINLGTPLSRSSLLPLLEAQGQQKVAVSSLDDLVAIGEAIRLVKIDVEGFELEVWRGMQRIIRENPKLIVLVELVPAHLARLNQSAADWIHQFSSVGFKAYEIDKTTGTLKSLRDPKELENVHSLNLFMTRERSDAFPELNFQS